MEISSHKLELANNKAISDHSLFHASIGSLDISFKESTLAVYSLKLITSEAVGEWLVEITI